MINKGRIEICFTMTVYGRNIHEVQLTSDVQQSGKTLVTCSHPKKDHRANSRKKQKSKLQENQTKEI